MAQFIKISKVLSKKKRRGFFKRTEDEVIKREEKLKKRAKAKNESRAVRIDFLKKNADI